MIGATLGHYRILAELGRGGMGEVFRAEDTILKRQVALKILPIELSGSPERLRRFRREAESLAALNHPGIVTIYSVETAMLTGEPVAGDGSSSDHDPEIHFLTMELVEGKSLARLIPVDGMPLERIFEIAVPLADAISAAHQAGVVHRDLKPANIMISDDGRIKVLDFGLAKVRSALDAPDATQTITETLTAEGAVVGTVPYMSPEQLEGRDIDTRSDLFSLGVILYEMATGVRPFQGDTPISLISAIVKDTPSDVDVVRGDLPHHLSRIISHCIEKDPADRLQSALDVRNELRTLREEIGSGAPATRDPSGPSKAPTMSRARRWTVVSLLALVTVLAMALWYRSRSPSPLLGFEERDWVLVTEFQRPEEEGDIADALALALRVGLEESGYVNVVPRSRIDNALSMMRLDRGSPIDLALGREISQRSGFKALLTPELVKIGEEYLVTLSLTSPVTGESVASFSERAGDQGALLDTVEVLIERLRRGLGESMPRLDAAGEPLDFVTTDSLEALMRFTEGNKQWKLGQHDEAVRLFREAVEIDPQFASAYAALGNAYSSYLFNQPDESRRQYEKALALLDQVGEREQYFIRASFQSHFGQPEDAIGAFRQYLDRYPDDTAARYNLGGIYRDLGACDEATSAYAHVLQIDPDSAGALINTATCISSTEPQRAVELYQDAFRIRPQWETSGNLNHEYAMTLLLAGRGEQARRTIEKRLAATGPSERGSAHRSLGQLSLYLGQFDQAAEHFETAAVLHGEAPESAGRDLLFWALGEIGRAETDRARELLQQSRSLIPEGSGWIWMRSIVGLAFLAAGDEETAKEISDELQSWAAEHPDASFDNLRRRELLAARIAAVDGELDLALESLEEIHTVEQADNAFLPWALAEVALMAEDWPRAEDALRELLALRWIFYETLVPWVQAHQRLGLTLDHLGRSDEADAQYQRFLDLWGEADSPIPELEETRRRLSQPTD